MYILFAQSWTTIPSMVTVLTLYYGGQFALTPVDHPAHMKAGDLVSFMLYQQALSISIENFGWLLTGISGALGAADKVFAIINRKPDITPPGSLQLGTTNSGRYVYMCLSCWCFEV
jgi:ABC-type multidrug transport system fused ATPase/permease subunit